MSEIEKNCNIHIELMEEELHDIMLKAVAELEQRAYSVPWSAESVADTLSYDHNFIITASSGEKLAGYLIFNLIMDQSELLRITVDETLRNNGIGRKLMDSYINEIKDVAESSLLEVRASNVPATALYESCGYEMLATRKGYYSEPVEDALVMSLTF